MGDFVVVGLQLVSKSLRSDDGSVYQAVAP